MSNSSGNLTLVARIVLFQRLINLYIKMKLESSRNNENLQKSGTESLSSGTISRTTSTNTTMARNVVTSSEILSSRSSKR